MFALGIGLDVCQHSVADQINRDSDRARRDAERLADHALCAFDNIATHLLEQNVDVRVIQVLLGHTKLDTTARYTQVATNTIRNVTSPLDHLIGKKDEPPA